MAPVITIVLYWGREKWNRPLRLHDMLEFPPELERHLKPFVADYPMNLIQMAYLPPHVRRRLRSDFRLLAEYAACEGKDEELEALIGDKSYVIKHPEEFLDALSTVAGDRRYEETKQQILEKLELRFQLSREKAEYYFGMYGMTSIL